MPITIRRIRDDEGPVLRSIRLQALIDAPTAFAMTYAQEATYPARHWEQAARTRADSPTDATFFAEDGDRILGLVGAYRSCDGWLRLVSMWVAPDARGAGIATALTAAVVEMARGAGAPGVRLWVNATNEPAIRTYSTCGFDFDGTTQPLPSHPEATEARMALDLVTAQSV